MTTKSTRKVVRVSHLTFVAVLRRLMQSPCTAQEIADASGLHKDTVYELLRAMRKGPVKDRVAHINWWKLDSLGRANIAVFKLGPDKDCERYKAKP